MTKRFKPLPHSIAKANKLFILCQNIATFFCLLGVVRELPITEWAIIVNADGIYLTTLSALLLDLRLYKSGYFSEQGQTPLLTEVI